MTAIELSERIENGELTIAKFYEREAGFQPGLTENKKATAEALRLIKIGERQQWIPVSERLPDDEVKSVDIWLKAYGIRETGYFYNKNKKEFYNFTDRKSKKLSEVSHWRYSIDDRPELPKEDNNGR